MKNEKLKKKKKKHDSKDDSPKKQTNDGENLRHLDEPLGRAEGLLEAVSFKKATESMDRGRVANARWE